MHRVGELAAMYDLTPFMVVLAAFAIFVGRRAGQTEVVTGMPVAGRDRPETEDLIGLFVNTLPLRLRVPSGATFIETLDSTRDTVLSAQAHAHLPFERIVDELALARELSRTPLFQISACLGSASARPSPGSFMPTSCLRLRSCGALA